uniref:Uncharacterized protein n=1 Tax=Panagrolaimus sp. PS1159 TaxID=55785 RepID=A0AC35GWI3_9BILA
MLWAKILLIAACLAAMALTQDDQQFYDDPSSPERPRPDRCQKWSDWKNVTCWWPDMSFADLPKECTYMPLPKKIPQVVQDLIRGKAQEAYDAVLFEYEQRGKPPKCGYCSRSFKCRSRNITQNDDSMNSDFDRRHHRRGGGRGRRDQCK